MEKGACLCETVQRVFRVQRDPRGLESAWRSCVLHTGALPDSPPAPQPHHVQAFRVNLGVASKCTVVQK